MGLTDDTKIRFQVGIFMLLGLAIAAGMVIYFGRLGDGLKSYYTIRVEYSNASGLLRGAEVLLSGAKIGKVSDGPHILPDMRGVYVELKLLETAQIPDDSIFTIGSSGLLGDRFVDILMPAERPGEKITFLEPGAIVQGKRETGLGDMMQEGGDFIGELRETIQKVNQVVTRLDSELLTPATLQDMQASVGNLRTTTGKLAESAEKFDGLLTDTSAKVDLIVTDARETIGEGKKLLISANKSAKTMETTTSDIQKVVADVRRGKGTIGMLLSNQQVADNIQALINNMRRHGVLWYKDSEAREEQRRR